MDPMETLTEAPMEALMEATAIHTDMETTPMMIPMEVRLCLGKNSLLIRKNKL